ncbi:MAG: hypothetical protein CL434_11625, partial [Acidimicrobiaceae bacterium]|nr:hypothetical protein [Acidimicrobiaceae bacterium]
GSGDRHHGRLLRCVFAVICKWQAFAILQVDANTVVIVMHGDDGIFLQLVTAVIDEISNSDVRSRITGVGNVQVVKQVTASEIWNGNNESLN